ncbi:EutN/CcmL family microcompartment protein [Cetobacterium sp. SF1]|uniref:EutN/CcmL family microcompartment protein n=1 Tax=unclassified Cetobacterium TaxID=2630983 RepID=UPI003CEAB240
MIVGRVIDNIWATRKGQELNGLKFMLVEELGGHGQGRRLVAVDTIGAGIGDRVIITTGFAAREMVKRDAPVDAAVIAIVDEDCQFK